MTHRGNTRNKLMAALLMREIGRATTELPLGSTNLFVRAALVVAFLYLLLLSFTTLGITGPVFISILFLTAFFVPAIYQAVGRKLEGRRRHGRGSPGVALPADGRRDKAERDI